MASQNEESKKAKTTKGNSIMKKQNILALVVKPAMRVTKSAGMGCCVAVGRGPLT
jgi:hypothetical protein